MKSYKVILSVIMVLVLLVLSVIPALAVTVSDVEWKDKISDDLASEIESASDNNTFPVWVWYYDINQDRVDILTEQMTGLTAEKCEVIKELPSEKLIAKVTKGDTTAEAALADYIDHTAAARTKESKLTQEFVEARRKVASELYTTKSATIIAANHLAEDSICFKSEFAPMMIAELSKEEIIRLAKNSLIEEINLYYEEEGAEKEEIIDIPRDVTDPAAELAQEAMGLPEVYERLGLTGSGVKIGLLEGNVPGIMTDDQTTYDLFGFDSDNLLHVTYHQVNDFNNVQQIVNNAISGFEGDGPLKVITLVENYNGVYQTPDPHENWNNTGETVYLHSHANHSVKIMAGDQIGIAKEAQIYASLQGIGKVNDAHEVYRKYANLEALIKCGINILEINIAIHNNSIIDADKVSTETKYYEHLVSFHNLTVVIPGGNGYDTSNSNFGQWISPIGLAYNAITVGGCTVSKDTQSGVITYTRKDYRWQNTSNTFNACEKPDVILPVNYFGGGTSTSSPAMAAIIALMMELKPSLKYQPHAVKAIALASCHHKANPHATDVNYTVNLEGIDVRQGAGVPDAWVMAAIILLRNYHVTNLSTGHTFTKNITLNSTANYNINFSIAWIKQNRPSDTLHYDDSHIIEVPIPNVNLYLVDSTIASTLSNSSTEMCYFPMSIGEHTYSLRMENLDSTRNAQLAYAWSTSDREKELLTPCITGVPAAGKTLSVAECYCNDGTKAPVDTLNYQWQRSFDGSTWSTISGAETKTYVLTIADTQNYIRCAVTPKPNSFVISNVKYGETDIKVVRYGDVYIDGQITTDDATLVQRYLAQYDTLTPEQMLAADVTGDGEVNVFDVVYIQMYIENDIDHFPVEE